jgi:hypothetical protein
MPALFRFVVLAVAVVVLVPRAARAQREGHAPIVLQLPASARALALADAWSGGRDVDAIFYNPAQLAGQRAALGFSLQRWGGSSTAGSLVGTYPFWRGVFGWGVQQLEWGAPSDVYPGAAPGSAALNDRGPFNALSTALSIGYGMTVKGFRVGLATKYAEDRTGNNRDGVGMVDAGLGGDVGFVSVGLSIRNMGSEPRLAGTEAALPTRVALGAATLPRPLGPFDLAANAEVATLRDQSFFAGLGAELSWTPIEGITGTGRVGVRTPVGDAGSPVTLGAAFTLDRVAFEYAWEGMHGPGNGHRVGLRLR